MDFKGVWTAFKASIIASSCCSLPLMIALLLAGAGASSWTAALRIPQYKFFFISVGNVFLFVSLYLTIRRRCGSCSLADVRRQKTLVFVSLGTYVLLTFIIIYLVLPIFFEWAFSLL